MFIHTVSLIFSNIPMAVKISIQEKLGYKSSDESVNLECIMYWQEEFWVEEFYYCKNNTVGVQVMM